MENTKIIGSKALNLLKTIKCIDERANEYEVSIQKQVQKEIIDPLLEKRDSLKDNIYDLEDFTLETSINKGRVAMSRKECAERFKQLIDAKFNLKMLEIEIEEKQKIFIDYFNV